MKRAFFSRLPHVFMSHHLRVRLRLVSKNAARQVGDAHRASLPSRSPVMTSIASAAITPRASSTPDADPSRHRRSPVDVRTAEARPRRLQSLMVSTVAVGRVSVPSLPGFGYSDRPTTTGWGTEKIAAAWVQLMGRLGYDRYLAHGGDWGGNITTVLAGRFPGHVLGVHTLFAEAPPGLSVDGLTADERRWTEETRDFWHHRAAYAKQQATRPQTLGYSLVDSPVGLLAWILDKFAEWSDTEDSPFETISIDAILDDVTLYWLTRTGASAARIYYESHNSLDPELRVDVPSAITMYPRDIEKCPRPWAEQRYRRIVRWQEPETGGHFPSLEVPDHFVRDLQEGLAAVLAVTRTATPSGGTT